MFYQNGNSFLEQRKQFNVNMNMRRNWHSPKLLLMYTRVDLPIVII